MGMSAVYKGSTVWIYGGYRNQVSTEMWTIRAPVCGADLSNASEPCWECSPGYELVGGQCAPCRQGTYNNFFSNQCLPCPAGTYGIGPAAITKYDCWPCNEGWFAREEG